MATETATLADAAALPEIDKPSARIWRKLKGNRLAMGGLGLLILFVLLAFLGWLGTTGSSPLFDPSTIRLPDKLKPPLSLPTVEKITASERPT